VVESVDSEYQGRVQLVRVDAAEDPDGARALGGFLVPLLVAQCDGREHARKLGAATAAEVRAVFEAALAGGPIASAGISRNERALRLLAGLGLVGVGLATGPRWALVAAGATLLVLAFHDLLRRR
jgi:thioredoxin-like negative regulator of GroEL